MNSFRRKPTFISVREPSGDAETQAGRQAGRATQGSRLWLSSSRLQRPLSRQSRAVPFSDSLFLSALSLCCVCPLVAVIIAILSFTPLSPKSPLPAVAPLVFVLAITAIKEALEDYKRHKVDVIINATLVRLHDAFTCGRGGKP